MRAVLSIATIAVALSGCSRFPAVNAASDPAALKAPYPQLLPVAALPQAGAFPIQDPAGGTLAALAARLRAATGTPQG